MANPEHLAILKQGVEAWNKWRQGLQRKPLPDLAGANLSGAQLKSIDLSGVDLSYCNLQSASLSGADFRCAFLKRTRFAGANIVAARFGNVFLRIGVGEQFETFSRSNNVISSTDGPNFDGTLFGTLS